jgi:ABC-2 type transport system ATP-binding protein
VNGSTPPPPPRNVGSSAFQATDVVKTYDGGKTFANDGITLGVHPGEVYGLLGPNGAGKTTLVKQVIGLLKPTSGSITLGPYDFIEDPDVARQLCSYLRGGPPEAVRERTDELIAALELEEWRNTLGTKMSGGVRRLVGFIMTTVWPGRVVILDEPTNDVDPLRRRLMWEQIRKLAHDGVAVFLVTHNVMEAEKSVDRLAIIDQGKLVAEGTPSSLKAEDRQHLRLQLMLSPGTDTPSLPEFVAHDTRVGNNLITVISEDAAATGIAWAQEQMQLGVADEYALGAITLEDVYVRLTGHASAIEVEA